MDFEPQTLLDAAVDVLQTANATEKVRKTDLYAEKWNQRLFEGGIGCEKCRKLNVPLEPALPEGVEIVQFNQLPKRGGAQSLSNRTAMLHALAHIEFAAINLGWDMISRFGDKSGPLCCCGNNDKNTFHTFPMEFYDDWVRIAKEEAKHHRLLAERLESLGSSYGALAAHAGLWDSATETSDSVLSRLAIVHMVHEARGLDRHPETIKKFTKAQDQESVTVLDECIYPDEITHVASGIRWFSYLCGEKGMNENEIVDEFQRIVRERFRGNLKPPFNVDGRNKAGMSEKWYMPLVE